MSKILLIALVSLFILSGCNKEDPKENVLTESEVKEIVLQKVENGKIAHLEFDENDKVPNYEVQVLDENYEYDFKINAVSGEIIETEKEKIQSSNNGSTIVDENEESTIQGTSLSEEKAKSIALSKLKGTRVIKIEFENENNTPVYDITLVDDEYKYEMEIDATNGNILSEEKEKISQ